MARISDEIMFRPLALPAATAPVVRPALPWLTSPPVAPLALLAGWRLILLLAAVVATQLGNESPPQGVIDLLIRATDRWDAGWYLAIARDGYTAGDASGLQDRLAFSPLLPLLIRLAHLIIPSWRAAGIIVTQLALAGAIIYLDRLVRLDFDRSMSLRAVAALLLFPTAPFLGAIYTEPLLLLALIAAIYHARRGQWWAAGAWGAVAGLTKLVGAVVLLPLLWEWWHSPARRVVNLGVMARHLAGLALVPLGALAFFGYLQYQFGSYSVYFAAQAAWYRESFFQPFLGDSGRLLTAFWQGDRSVINYFYPQGAVTLPSANAFMLLDLLFLVGSIVLGVAVCWRLRPSYSLLIFAVFAVAIFSGSPQSLNRFALILFPLPLALAHLSRRPVVGFALLTFSGLLCVFHFFLLVNGYWAG